MPMLLPRRAWAVWAACINAKPIRALDFREAGREETAFDRIFSADIGDRRMTDDKWGVKSSFRVFYSPLGSAADRRRFAGGKPKHGQKRPRSYQKCPKPDRHFEQSGFLSAQVRCLSYKGFPIGKFLICCKQRHAMLSLQLCGVFCCRSVEVRRFRAEAAAPQTERSGSDAKSLVRKACSSRDFFPKSMAFV